MSEVEAKQTLSFCEENFGYNYFSLMVPPFVPRSILILGYGNGTVHRLIQKIWPYDVVVTGVDLVDPPDYSSDMVFVPGDAGKFVRECKSEYDYVVVDLFQGKVIPPFVFSDDFVDGLGRICVKLLGINCTFYRWDDFACYDRRFSIDCVKQVNHDKVLMFNPK